MLGENKAHGALCAYFTFVASMMEFCSRRIAPPVEAILFEMVKLPLTLALASLNAKAVNLLPLITLSQESTRKTQEKRKQVLRYFLFGLKHLGAMCRRKSRIA